MKGFGNVDSRPEVCSDPNCVVSKTDILFLYADHKHYHMVYYNPKTKKEYRKYGFCRICHQSYRTMKSITGEYCRQHRGISMKPNTSCDICGLFTRFRRKEDLFNLKGYYCAVHVMEEVDKRTQTFGECLRTHGLSVDLINYIIKTYIKQCVFWRYRECPNLVYLTRLYSGMNRLYAKVVEIENEERISLIPLCYFKRPTPASCLMPERKQKGVHLGCPDASCSCPKKF